MRLPGSVLSGLLFFSVLAIACAALIDEIAVTVGNQAITESQIEQEIRLSSLLNDKPAAIDLVSRREAAGRLIEQALIRREMSFGAYAAVPAAQVDEALASTEKARGGAAALDSVLARYGVSKPDLRRYLEWQLALLKFIELRFRPAVEVSDEDIEGYYKAHVAVVPSPDGTTPNLRELREQIERKLTGERVDTQLNEWIQRSRKRTGVRYVDGALADSTTAEVRTP